jgi:hypothetical protein
MKEMYERTVVIGIFTLVYQYTRPLRFVGLTMYGSCIVKDPFELHRLGIFLKAYVSNRLSAGEHPVNAGVVLYRERVGHEEFIMLKAGDLIVPMDKTTAMEMQSILERFISRIDLFDIPL